MKEIEIEFDIKYDDEFRDFIKKVLGVLWVLCIIALFVGGDLEGGGGLLTSFAYFVYLPIVIIPIWFVFGRWKFVALSLIFFLFLFFISFVIVDKFHYNALHDSQEIGYYIGAFLAGFSLIGIVGTLLIALVRAIWSLIKKELR
ncbi:Uncharacterised protein [Helicobacter fennelliae]|uniref:Uncharacterized protein n=1 Tax=Helicobacter fennelliae TaxID=215 RepID=A0A2X3EN20_9HELI|nr:hypothetical protein [Helicobacter fennelliae]SQC36407.1 Uncharacterised protein [Helicobacter fennelliae]